jgi:hypothetical protein
MYRMHPPDLDMAASSLVLTISYLIPSIHIYAQCCTVLSQEKADFDNVNLNVRLLVTRI